MTNPQHFMGGKYDQRRDITEDRKLMLKDIKAAILNGELPALKVSIRCRKFSGQVGRAIDVRLSEIKNTPLVNPEWVRRELAKEWGAPVSRYSDELAAVVKKVEAIAQAYNYDRGDVTTDYFDQKFYLSVDADITQAIEDAKIAFAEGRAINAPPPPPPPPATATVPPMRAAGIELAKGRSYWTGSIVGVAQKLGLSLTFAGRNRTSGTNGPDEVAVLADSADFDASPIVLVYDGCVGGNVSYTRIR